MRLLDAVLADAETRQQQQPVAIGLGLVDGGDVAQYVGRGHAVGIVTALSDIDEHAGQVGGVDLDARHLFPAKVFAHGDRHPAAPATHFAQDAGAIGLADFDDGAQCVERLFDRRRLLRNQHHTVVLLVVGQRYVETIDNTAAGRRQQAQVDAVFVGQRPVFVGFENLQVIHARSEG